jgi:hypothetical protein
LVNVLFGLMIIGITSRSPVSIVPIVVSVAGAIANGLCYVKNLISLFHLPSSLLLGACCKRLISPGFFSSNFFFFLLNHSSMPSTQIILRLAPWLQRQLQT